MRSQRRKRGFLSKFSYEKRLPIEYGAERVMIPDEVLDNPALYADEGIEFPAHILAKTSYKGVPHPYLITKEFLRLGLERDAEDPLRFKLRARESRPLVMMRYWEIRLELEHRMATVHVTKCTRTRLEQQIWPTWDEKLCTPGLAVDLQPTKKLREGEVLAWKDEWNEQLRVSVHEADEAQLPPVFPLEKLRWTQSAIKAWSESDEAIR